MAILRAGPWGSLTETHADPVTDFSVEPTVFPVNCAKDDWPNQVWGAVYSKTAASTTEHELAELNETISASGTFPVIEMQFCYQSTQGFDIEVNWDIVFTDFSLPDISWSYTTIEGSSDSFFNTPADSGTETVTLPASTFGVFGAALGGGTEADIDLSLS